MAQYLYIEWSGGWHNRFYADSAKDVREVLDDIREYAGTITEIIWPHEWPNDDPEGASEEELASTYDMDGVMAWRDW